MSKYFEVVEEISTYYYNGNGNRVYLKDMEDRQIVSAINSLSQRVLNLSSIGDRVNGPDELQESISNYQTAITRLLQELGSRQDDFAPEA